MATDLQSIDFFKPDHIILQTESWIKMIDRKGNTIDSLALNKNSKDQKSLYSNIYEVPISYNPQKNTISVFKYCYICYERSKDYYSRSIQSSVNLDTKEVVDDNVFYPEIYKLYNLGYLDGVYRSGYGDLQFFTFMPDHRIFVYNTSAKTMNIFDGTSEYSTNQIKILSQKNSKDIDKLLQHLVEAQVYRKLVYDQISHSYFRLFSKPIYVMPELKTAKLDNYIQVFDDSFKIVAEIKVPKINPVTYFAYNNKLYWISIKKDQTILYNYSFI